jgi:hypothetical protein
MEKLEHCISLHVYKAFFILHVHVQLALAHYKSHYMQVNVDPPLFVY